jgi:hypothetical protein
MKQHPDPGERNDRFFPASSRSRPAEAAEPDPRIEDYLDRVSAPLVDLVSYDTRQELRAELRSHLEALSASYEELGASRDRAVRAALRQLGDARLVADRYAQLSSGALSPGGSLPAWAGVLAAFACAGLVEPISQFLTAWLPGCGWGNHALLWDIIVHGAPLTGMLGLGVGLVTPRRANWLTLGIAALIPLTLLGESLQQFLVAFSAHGATPGPNGLAILLLNQTHFLLPLAPIGCAGAALGEWLRNRLPRRQPRWAIR